MGINTFGHVYPNILCEDKMVCEFDDLESNPFEENAYKIISDKARTMVYLQAMNDETFQIMIDRETNILPTYEFLVKSVRDGDVDLSDRTMILSWIYKAHAVYELGPMTFCLSINYLDRFLSVYRLPREAPWAMQLVALACLSLAIKVEDNSDLLPINLQVCDPKYVFKSKDILKAELLVLSTLKWRMQACTPVTFIEYFLEKIIGDNQLVLHDLVLRSNQLIVYRTLEGSIDLLEYKPSEIAAAVAISVSKDFLTGEGKDLEEPIMSSTLVEKERVMKCLELVTHKYVGGCKDDVSSALAKSPPHSPILVSDCDKLWNNTATTYDPSTSEHNTSSNGSNDSKKRKRTI